MQQQKISTSGYAKAVERMPKKRAEVARYILWHMQQGLKIPPKIKIQKKLGVSRSVVVASMKELGISADKLKRRNLCDKFDRYQRTDDAKKLTTSQIEKKYSIIRSTAVKWVHGIYRPSGWATYQLSKDPDLSVENIDLMSAKYNCAPKLVRKALVERGLLVRQASDRTYGDNVRKRKPNALARYSSGHTWSRSKELADYIAEKKE